MYLIFIYRICMNLMVDIMFFNFYFSDFDRIFVLKMDFILIIWYYLVLINFDENYVKIFVKILCLFLLIRCCLKKYESV